MAEFDRSVPILGQEKQKIRATPPSFTSLVRTLDENGTFEPEGTFLNNGQVQAIAGRSNICSAEDLCDMITDAVWARLKLELKEMLKELKG